MEKQILDFFTADLGNGMTRADIISVSAVERAAGVPKGVLYSFLSGRKYYHLGKHEEILFNFLKKLGL